MSDPRPDAAGVDAPASAAGVSAHGDVVASTRWSRLRHQWHQRLDPTEQLALLSWATFSTMFVALRVLTHWIRAGHGPKGGGISLGGRHFHHYNIGIALLLDLEDVYWSSAGRKSVDVAVGVIAVGATFFTGLPFWPHANRALQPRR